GEWTPSTITRSPYLCSILRNCGNMCMQLIQQKVQKSMIASRPRRSAMCSGRATLSQSRPCGKSGARTVPAWERSAIHAMVRSPDRPPWHERYNRTNTMFASAASRLGWRRARPAPRPSRRTLLIAVVVAGLGLSVPGANAVARNDPSILSAPGAAEDAAVQAEATQLSARYHADPAALLASAQAALATGRNDATIAYFLKRGWADRLNAALERYGAMLGTAD